MSVCRDWFRIYNTRSSSCVLRTLTLSLLKYFFFSIEVCVRYICSKISGTTWIKRQWASKSGTIFSIVFYDSCWVSLVYSILCNLVCFDATYVLSCLVIFQLIQKNSFLRIVMEFVYYGPNSMLNFSNNTIILSLQLKTKSFPYSQKIYQVALHLD